LAQRVACRAGLVVEAPAHTLETTPLIRAGCQLADRRKVSRGAGRVARLTGAAMRLGGMLDVMRFWD